MTDNTKPTFDGFKLFISALVSVMTATVLYAATQLVQSQITDAEMKKDIAHISKGFEEFKATATALARDRYTSGMAEADWELQDRVDTLQNNKIDRNIEWVQRLSTRLADLESFVREQKE